MDHVAFLCAQQRARRRSIALSAGLDQVKALIRDALDEAGIGPDNPLFDQHAVIVLNLIYELARLGADRFTTKIQAIDAAITTSALVFGEKTGR